MDAEAEAIVVEYFRCEATLEVSSRLLQSFLVDISTLRVLRLMKVEINPDIDGITTVVFSVCSEKMTADQFYESVTEGLLYEKYGTMIKPVVPPKNVSKA